MLGFIYRCALKDIWCSNEYLQQDSVCGIDLKQTTVHHNVSSEGVANGCIFLTIITMAQRNKHIRL